MLNIDEIEKENIPQLLQDKDILSFSKLEEGISGISGSGISGSGISNGSENSNNSDIKKPKVNPVTVLKNYLTYSPFQSAKLKGYEFTFTTAQQGLETGYKERREKLIKSLGVIDNEYKTTNTWADLGTVGNFPTVICKVKLN
jgi:hypothetical protein